MKLEEVIKVVSEINPKGIEDIAQFIQYELCYTPEEENSEASSVAELLKGIAQYIRERPDEFPIAIEEERKDRQRGRW